MKAVTGFCITAILSLAPVLAQTVKQDLKNAGTQTKQAFTTTGKAAKRTAGKVKHKTKHAVHKTSSKVANKTAGH